MSCFVIMISIFSHICLIGYMAGAHLHISRAQWVSLSKITSAVDTALLNK